MFGEGSILYQRTVGFVSAGLSKRFWQSLCAHSIGEIDEHCAEVPDQHVASAFDSAILQEFQAIHGRIDSRTYGRGMSLASRQLEGMRC